MGQVNSTISFDQVFLLAEKFFDSLEHTFRNTLKYRSKSGAIKKNKWEIMLDLNIFGIIFSILPAIPAIFFLLCQEMKIELIDLMKYDFFIWWGFCIFIIVPVLFKLAIFSKKKEFDFQRKHQLQEEMMIFCYLLKSIKEIELYFENNIFSHIETAKNLLKIYFDKSDRNILVYKTKEKVVTKPIYEILRLLNSYYKWFKLEQSYENIINAFKDTQNKIFQRIINQVDLDIIVQPLKLLAVYEYSKLKIIPAEMMKSTLDIFQKNCLLLYSIELSSINEFRFNQAEGKTKKIDFIIRWIEYLKDLFTSEKIYISFPAWYVVLQAVVVIVTKFLINRYNVQIDSTIISVVVAVPIAGATALVTLIVTNQRKKKETDDKKTDS